MKNLGGLRKQSRRQFLSKQKEEKMLETKDDIAESESQLMPKTEKPEKELRYKTPENRKKDKNLACVSKIEVTVINPEQAILAVQAVQAPTRGKNRQSYYCDLCLVQLNSYENMREHRRCKKHWENCKAQQRMKKLENSLEELKIKDIRRLSPKN